MRWPPWRRKEKGAVFNDWPELINLEDQARFAEEARARASKDLHETRKRGAEVTRVVASLNARIQVNHWAEMLEESFRRERNG